MIDPATLTPEQYAGRACVIDPAHPVWPDSIPVGLLGLDLHYVHACPGHCARQVDALVMERTPSPAHRPVMSARAGARRQPVAS